MELSFSNTMDLMFVTDFTDFGEREKEEGVREKHPWAASHKQPIGDGATQA